jgi:hypothetical protein
MKFNTGLLCLPAVRSNLSTLNLLNQEAVAAWEERLNQGQDYLRLCPVEYRDNPGLLTEREARGNHQEVSAWMTSMKIRAIQLHQIKQAESGVEARPEKLCMEIGLANLLRGYGYLWVALAASLRLRLVDFAPTALEDCKRFVSAELSLPPHSKQVAEIVKWGEATRVCEKLDKNTGVLLLFTLVEHIGMGLPKEQRLDLVSQTLRSVGKVLADPANVVQICNTPPEGNTRLRKGSMAVSDDLILEQVQAGAGRKIHLPYDVIEYSSRTSRFTCLTMTAE